MWSDNQGDIYAGSEHPEGELAAFALNALDDAEFQAVFHHVIRCLHCQEVLLGFQDTAARLASAAPEVDVPPGLKQRALANATGRADRDAPALGVSPAPRWSTKRLRRWVAPVAIGALSLLLAASVGFMISQHREINNLSVGQQPEAKASASPASAETPRVDQPAANEQVVTAEAAAPAVAISQVGGSLNLTPADAAFDRSQTSNAQTAGETESVDLVKQEVSDMVEATVLSAQPETEKLAMTSPMGTETAARGLLMIHPSGTQGVLMVTGMPADSYQIWLLRHDDRQLIDRIVVNENDGSGVKDLELDESMFGFHEVALMPDERHGPTVPTGEKFLSARILGGPPVPPAIWRGR